MPSPPARKTILIIDDDADVRLFLTHLMEVRGFTPICAENRAEGLKLAESERPDCIILNCLLCGEDGMTLYKSLKKHDLLRFIPVVMLSAVGKEIIFQHWMLGGAIPEPDVFLESPPEGNTILSWVSALTRSGARKA